MAALTTALLAMTAAKTGMDYLGQRRQADSAVQQGNYAGTVYDQNATLADSQAADAIARGQQASNQRGVQTRQVVGSQRANYAAQGIDVNTGSASDVQGDTKYLGELDRQTIQTNAAREAWGYSVEASQDRNNANMARAGGQQTAAGLRAGATSTLLTGALNMYGQGKDAGMWGQSSATRAGGRGMIATRGWGG